MRTTLSFTALLTSTILTPEILNKLKSLKVAKSKDDGGGAVDCSIDAGDMNGVLMLCVMVHVLVWVMVC